MKNIKYIIIFAFIFFNVKSFAQLPLQFGDGVITHSPSIPSTSSVTSAVVRTVKISNTSSAPLGTNWNTSTMIPPGTKLPNYAYANWTSSVLGNVFGITLDQNTNPNIYVSNTQIYGMPLPAFKGKIWRLDGNTGANSLVFDFNNINLSLGNLKYKKIGSVENIYVSNWENGNIERLNGNSTSTSGWLLQAPFNPKFGLNVDNPNFLPYGIAIRNMSGGNFRLYYAKINKVSPFSTNEIWSVNLNSSGDFIASSEQMESIPTASLTNYTDTVIADLTFTENGNKMLVGQQTFSSFGKLCAHRSNVAEFIVTSTDHLWSASPNIFNAGQYSGMSSFCNSGSGNWNSIGGVSYSNNPIKGNQNTFECDSSVWFVSDAVTFASSAFAYGLQGMNANGGATNNLSNSIVIDDDDYIINSDKMQLGDVEIYKNPQTCNPCQCGQWENIALGTNGNWWNPTSSPTPPTLTFNQGSSTGILFPHYLCNGNCAATYTYSVTNANGNNTPLTGTTNLDLSQPIIKNLPCGSYFINITPKCGNVVCPPIRIPLVIVCPPPCSDCGGNASVTANGTPTISNGTISGNFTINNSKPVSEVRVLVEEFRVTSANENCLVCKNPPKTWGSIQTATLGTLSPAFSNALTIDNREVVFNNGGILPMPSNASITLALPQSVNLSCCEVKVEICLKFIIRDVNCCEKEILKCFTFTLPQS